MKKPLFESEEEAMEFLTDILGGYDPLMGRALFVRLKNEEYIRRTPQEEAEFLFNKITSPNGESIPLSDFVNLIHLQRSIIKELKAKIYHLENRA